MGFDKAKAVRAAEKQLAQGKISAAIQEYLRVVQYDPEDYTALNTLGDLYVRVEQKQEAVRCFARVAAHYRDQGFTLKAIAVYKKVSRIQPGDIDTSNTLATLYEKQGHLVEARTQYLTVADAYARAGQSRDALNVLSRIANLDPNNIDIRLRLADGLRREGAEDKAADVYIEAGDMLAARADYDRSLAAYTSALTIRPGNHAALQGLVTTHTALGTADESAEILEHAITVNPADIELRAMLARAYIEAENAAEAERATTELVSRQASSYPVFFDVARLYLRQGNVKPAVEVLTHIIEPVITAREENVMLELLHETLALDPDETGALRLLARIYTWQRDDERLRTTLERIVEISEAAGLAEQERGALAQLVRLAPGEPRFRRRLEELVGAEEAFEMVTEPEQFTPSADEEVPTFESFLLADDAFGTETFASNAQRDDPTEFEWNAVTPPATSPMVAPTLPADSSISFTDINNFADASSTGFDISTSSEHASASFQEVDFSSPAQTPATMASPLPATAAALPAGDDGVLSSPGARLAALLGQELESVDFYLAQGYTDIARDTLDMLERQFGAQPGIDSRRRQMSANGASDATTQPAPPLASESEEIEFGSLAGYDQSFGESPTDARGLEESSVIALGGATFRDDATATTAETPARVEHKIDPSLAAIIDDFRAAAEEDAPPSPPDEDYEAHYNLGLAYKDIMLDQAIEEFQIASNMVTPRDGTLRYLECCNMLGHCFMQKGVPRAAVIWFKKALDSPGHDEDVYQALRYDLATAYEQMGDLQRAIEVFTEVYGIDVSYRGVSDKLRELQAQRSAK